MAKKTATIYDVAKKAGISIATVSRVLNTPQKVKSETKEKVYNAVSELGFTPKAEARDRAKRHVGKIGVISPYFTYPSFVHRLRGISEALKGTAFELVIINLEDKVDIEHYLRSPGLKDRIDGFIILSQKLNDSILGVIEDLSLKVVFVEFGEDHYSSVCIDNHRGGEIVAEFLLQKEYDSFGILTENEKNIEVHPNMMRVSGFVNTFKKHNRIIDDHKIIYTGNDLHNAMIDAEKLISEQKPDVIFATNDLLAIAVIKSARKLQISIPDDMGVIGFDGTNTSEYMDITTVDQSLEESGKIAVELLMKNIENPHSPTQTIFLPLKIIERETLTR